MVAMSEVPYEVGVVELGLCLSMTRKREHKSRNDTIHGWP